MDYDKLFANKKNWQLREDIRLLRELHNRGYGDVASALFYCEKEEEERDREEWGAENEKHGIVQEFPE